MVSPVSATSGQRSPWWSGRKGSIPQPRRPPSPGLTNLDCAFPPFPIPSRAATTRRRAKSSAHRSDTKRSKSRDAPKASPQGSAQPPVTRAGAPGNRVQNSCVKEQQGTQPGASGSKRQSLSSGNESNEPTVQRLPEVQITSIEENSLATSTGTEAPLPEPQSRPKVFRSHTEPESAWERPRRNGLAAFNTGNTGTYEIKPPNTQNDLIFNTTRIDDRLRGDTEPAYKSKRPPPLISDSDMPPLTKTKSPTLPQPSSAGSLSKGFGRLFGRRRSRSATSRREVVRQALSDEPDTYDTHLEGRSILSPGSDRSFLTAEPSPFTASPLRSPEPSPSHEESLEALEGRNPVPASPADAVGVAAPVVVIEPAVEAAPLPSVLTSEPELANAADPASHVEEATQTQASQVIEALRRLSVDSASSYGSVGFSEHTMSSRSSLPPPESLAIKPIDPAHSTLLRPSDVDMPAPLRPKAPESTLNIPPDSPTDPLFQQGRLSPIPDLPHQASDSCSSPPATHIDVPMNTQQTPEQDASLRNRNKVTIPNKGICRGCSQMILATQKSVSSADGRLTGRYHKECFVCQTCKAAFPTAEFYVHNDFPYCGQHYHELEDSLCASCGKGIEGLYMETANVSGRGKEKHHPECLRCSTCKIRLDHDYFELSGKVYCERDAFRLATLTKPHGNAPSRPSPLVREYISSGDPGLLSGRNFPERRTTRLMSTT